MKKLPLVKQPLVFYRLTLATDTDQARGWLIDDPLAFQTLYSDMDVAIAEARVISKALNAAIGLMHCVAIIEDGVWHLTRPQSKRWKSWQKCGKKGRK